MSYSKFLIPILFICFISYKNSNKASTKVNHDDFKTIHSDFKLTSIAIENGVYWMLTSVKRR